MNTQTREDYENLIRELIGFIDSKTIDPTPLIYFINKNKINAALTLIATGQGQVEKKLANNSNTTLQLSCLYAQESIAMALIATGKSRPDNVNCFGETALILACHRPTMQNVALALLETGNSNYGVTDSDGYNALYYARIYNLTQVVSKIEILRNRDFIASQTSSAPLAPTPSTSPVPPTSVVPTESTPIQTASAPLASASPTPPVLEEMPKCGFCHQDVLHLTNAYSPCGHSNIHSDCLLKEILRTQELPQKCSVCNKDVGWIISILTK